MVAVSGEIANWGRYSLLGLTKPEGAPLQTISDQKIFQVQPLHSLLFLQPVSFGDAL